MRAMKDSGIEWIGEIPQEWKTARIKHVIDRSEFGIKIGPFGSTLANRTLISGPYNVYSQANLISNSFSDTNHHIDRDTFVDLRGYEVKPGDVCVSMMGTIGKCKVVPERITEGIMDSHLIKIRLDETQIDPGFFEYVYDKDNSGVCFTQMQYEKKGTIMDGLNTAIVKNLVIPLPSLTDQIDISKYLDTKCAEIDALITSKEKTNALLRERRQSIIYEALTKGLDPTVPMKDSGVEWIGEIPEGWGIGKLGYFIEVYNGDRSSNYPSGNDLQEEGIPFLTSSNLEEDIIDTSTCKFISEEKYHSLAGFKMRIDDIVYCLRGSVGKCAINKTEHCGTIASSLMGIRCKSVDPDWLLYLLKSSVFAAQNSLYMNGTCAANLSAESICTYIIPVCSMEEQTAIADYLIDHCKVIDALIKKNEEEIIRIKEYRQSLIYEAVTGKIEV